MEREKVTIHWGLKMHTLSPSQRLGQMSLLIGQPLNPSVYLFCLSNIWSLPTGALVCPVPGGTGHGCWTTLPIIDALEPEVLFVAGKFSCRPSQAKLLDLNFQSTVGENVSPCWNVDSREAIGFWSCISDLLCFWLLCSVPVGRSFYNCN